MSAAPFDATALRRAFVDFFAARAHTVVPSAGLIPHHPTAPMFTNSGMMPFVPYFLGEEPAPWPRATSVQRCMRAGGKHNDLDAVGRSPRHLSFFEMLGNFSFGDYFKADAIPWAWQFFTDSRESGGLGLDGDRLWVTRHISDPESEEIWVDAVGFPRDRIQALDKDNFWEMGDTGPCGPSSEIFWDYGPELGPEGGPANPAAEHRYVELWNLVFTQYNRGSDGALTALPATNVDTGAGLERIGAAMVGSSSVFGFGDLAALVAAASEVVGAVPGESELHDIALNVIADHARSTTFLIADGVLPSNEDRGYVLRRIIRRAVYFAYILGVRTATMVPMAEHCIALMGESYPELAGARDNVLATLEREEDRFSRTLSAGSQLLNQELDRLAPGAALPGSVAFTLHDTHGFPLEVTQESAALRGVEVDLDQFQAEMSAQRERARAATKSKAASDDDVVQYAAVLAEHGRTEFVGRDTDTTTATVLAVVGDSVVTDRTPFYAESGGQVGDTGTIVGPNGSATVFDTRMSVPGLHRHVVGDAAVQFQPGDQVELSIDTERRAAIMRHHTATHILHWALREVLGDHVRQQGSLVAPDRLRFDFAHPQGVSPEEIQRIEDLSNCEILSNAAVQHTEMSKDEALARGAIAFFGEKYGDQVRVLEAGPHSVELCGGTHVHALGDIGPLRILSESSIGQNVRRIEAVAGLVPIDVLRQRDATLAEVADLVGVPVDDLADGVTKRLADLKAARDELTGLRRKLAAASAGDLVDSAIDGVIVARVEVDDRNELRDMALSLRDKPGVRAVVLGASPGGKGAALVAAVAPDSGLKAATLIADAMSHIGGGGGKGDEIASAGGKRPEGIDDALEVVRAGLGR
jgi:alanyl-tRNA synthetase